MDLQSPLLLNADNDGHARIQIYNEKGFTEKIPKGTVEAAAVQVIEPVDFEVIRNEVAVTTDQRCIH